VRLLEHVVAIRERVLAEDYPDRLNSQHELASTYLAEQIPTPVVGGQKNGSVCIRKSCKRRRCYYVSSLTFATARQVDITSWLLSCSE
jgi:hypothetical protein